MSSNINQFSFDQINLPSPDLGSFGWALSPGLPPHDGMQEVAQNAIRRLSETNFLDDPSDLFTSLELEQIFSGAEGCFSPSGVGLQESPPVIGVVRHVMQRDATHHSINRLTQTTQPNEVNESLVSEGLYHVPVDSFDSLSRASLEVDLINWAGSNCNKNKAKTRILECIEHKTSDLSLADLELESCPNIFHYPELQHLKILDLSKNKLRELPISIGLLKNLQSLDVCNNQLKELPLSIGLLKNLEDCALSHNNFIVLPESIGLLTNLKILSLNNNFFKALPESMCLLKNLQILFLSSNRFTIFPESLIGQPIISPITHLEKEMDALGWMDFSRLTTSGAIKLKSLYLDQNQLTTLPGSITQLAELELLDLSNNQFKERPLIIDQFKKSVTVSLSRNPFVISSNSESKGSKIKDLTKTTLLTSVFEAKRGRLDGHPASLREVLGTIQEEEVYGELFPKKTFS